MGLEDVAYSVIGIVALLLAWVTLRLKRDLLKLNDIIGRQNRRINQLLFQLSREIKNDIQKQRQSMVSFSDEKDSERIICPRCQRTYSSNEKKCPHCGARKPKVTKKDLMEWDDL